ncbi:MAG: AAA family ATPase [Patescibacteria group bacterium]
MHLERLEINGFKSFANKTILEFPKPSGDLSRGITAIVGPNGSGKSNILEAVRWGLGEQSLKSLRGKKSEDIIFSGSEKKSRLSLAEVSITFNNEDNGAPIDFKQFNITRRVYRNGEGEYFINNSQTRLQDIVMLLAKANVGQKSYSIVSQGMIDAILHSSANEKKIFFDEATGVRQYQIKKDAALRKLAKTQENLNQAEIVLQEIEPRLRSLGRQIKKLEQRQEIENRLRFFQKKYYEELLNDLICQLKAINNKLSTVGQEYNSTKHNFEALQKQFADVFSPTAGNIFKNLRNEYSRLQHLKDEYLQERTDIKEKLIDLKTALREKTGRRIKSDVNLTLIAERLKELINLYCDLTEKIKTGLNRDELLNSLNNKIDKIREILALIEEPQTEDNLGENELNKLEQKINQLNDLVGGLDGQMNDLDKKLAEENRLENEKMNKITGTQRIIRDEQLKLDKLSAEENEIKIGRARVETKIESLREEIRRETGATDLTSIQITDSGEIQLEENQNLTETIQRLKRQMELIGGIDPEITKEYPECKNRYEFLTAQTTDLKQAMQTLNRVVNELDKIVESQFHDSFNKINEKFDQYFKIFFGGGKAKLIFKKLECEEENEEKKESTDEEKDKEKEIDAEDELEKEKKQNYDVEILATPPGKKVKHIEVLSGGEKTLTSIALICAIIAINKPPFVILDEVDAALDEENSERFGEILRELDDKTQFLIITHNRRVMSFANILYGITMGEDKVSKLLSLKLEN